MLKDFVQRWVVPAGAIVALCAGLYAGFAYMVKAETADLRTKLQTTTSDIEELKEKLTKANDRIDRLVEKALDKALSTSTSKKEASVNLETASTALRLAREEDIKIDPGVINHLGKQFTEITKKENPPEAVWPAAVQLINYRSVRRIGPDYPSCNNGFIKVTGGPSPESMIATITYRDCTLNLDIPSIWTRPDLESQGKPISNWRLDLHNVIAHYTGASSLGNVKAIDFDRCILDFDVKSKPALYGQFMLTQLLESSNPEKIEVKLPLDI